MPWAVQFRAWGTPPRPTAPQPAAEVIAFYHPEHAVSAQYRALLTGLLAQLAAPRGQVLLFTSPAPWTGTTTVLLNLAVTAARHESRRVAVVDANLRRPALAPRLGLSATPGLCDVLAGSVPLGRALQETAQANLWALAPGRTGTSDARLPLDWLLPTLRQLREQFDLVFVDAPSWNEGSEVSALAATCDAVYVVLHHKDAPGGDSLAALPGLRQPPSNLQGCILTMR
jgi:Mrp family chromosome partitioning ATPase